MPTTTTEPTTKQFTGPAAEYRPKMYKTPVSVLFTREGRSILDRDVNQSGPGGAVVPGRTGLNRNDYLEKLVREFGHLIPNAPVAQHAK